jgi:hypothetical protein
VEFFEEYLLKIDKKNTDFSSKNNSENFRRTK